MINLNRLPVYIMMLGITLIIPSFQLLLYLDELLAYTLLGIALLDCVFNNAWRKYHILWILMSVMTVYAIYSIYFLNYNTTGMILKDWIIELKPFIPFAVILGLSVSFTAKDKQYIRRICIINVLFMFISLLCGVRITMILVSHPAYAGHVIYISSLFYLFCSYNEKTGAVKKRDLYITALMLTTGVLCAKAKYFAMFIPAVYLILFYKPGILRHFSAKHAMITLFLGIGIIAATWNKIQYYFLQGNSDTFDPTVIESFARPVLYVTSGLILVDHFPFGTGLASFASFPSAENYSNVYYEYGINNVHGIAPNSEPSFICDAFYPSLAQFGVVGIILFIFFWVYIYGYPRYLIRTDNIKYRVPFIISSIILIFIFAECTSGNALTQMSGTLSMMLLGTICAKARILKDNEFKVYENKELVIRKI